MKYLSYILLVIILLLSACTSITRAPDRSALEVNVVEPGTIKEYTIHGSSFKLDPPEITVNEGDTVRIIYVSDDIGHNLVIDEFNVRTNVISGGTSETLQFTADKKGTFDIYCSVGQHRDLGMEGKIIVT